MATDPDRLYITLYTDADVHGKLAEQIRQKGFDAVSAYEVGNAELDDPDQLEYAISQKRAILTCNAKDFAPLFDRNCSASEVRRTLASVMWRHQPRKVRCT